MHCRRDNPADSQHDRTGYNGRRHIALFRHLLPKVEWRELHGKRAGREENGYA